MNYVLVTGGTGFLGTQITKQLYYDTDYQIIVLIRGSDAYKRLSRAWWEYPELLAGVNERIHVYNGDITRKQLDLSEEDYNNLICNVTHIIHTAADLRLNAPLIELRKTNVEGTSNILQLAYLIQDNHELKRFSHISTAYVAGAREGVISEESLTNEYNFLSNYELSKFESELMVKNSNLPITIFRPGMIVGDSKTGYIKTFNTLYVPLRLYLTGKQRILPITSSSKINLVPIDYVVDAVIQLTFKLEGKGLTFHLTAPNDLQPTVDELIKYVREWMYQEYDYKLPTPVYQPLLRFIIRRLSNISFINIKTRKLLETVNTLMPYFNEKRIFKRDNTDKFYGSYELDWRVYLPNLLKFAVYYAFFHRSERTVYEQILFRIKSTNHPIKYYNIIDNEIIHQSSELIVSDIESTVRSLSKLGVNPGDPIALVGFNSTRYLTLDVAIGLIGAISVPLYYTSSIIELKEIIDDCQAKILFISNPDLINKLQKIDDEIVLISFTEELDKLPRNIMSWSEFLKLGDDCKPNLKPVNYSDTATIRYTSGTTGKPRGVTFTHANLRWMAEYIASMPPWKDRINKVSYLSFLPMNHVVEGILAMYSPYYAPAKLNLFYLMNFQDLSKALRRVKPTIFFSVPRYYEKLWSTLITSIIGDYYQKSGDGIKKVLKYLLRHVTLKRAGLNKCAQLIVGSAPISTELLKNYQDLGIEIYNAYGLTEAPLVTINHLGANRIKTVGEPLPLTKIQIASDGEVMVQGPQVTPGYYNNKKSPLQWNWLMTGDYGYLTKNGCLVITGRKKELIINSYGKSISPHKIESMIHDISHVTESLLVGEGKPYLTALIWIDDASIEVEYIFIGIREINSQVSHPEQIKKIVILKKSLSIEDGDLTANFKLKRGNILNHYNKVINYIYNDGERPDDILHYYNMNRGKN